MLLLATSAVAQADATFVYGPIESVSSQSLTVLGQKFAMPSGKYGKALRSVDQKLSPGTLVLIEGTSDQLGRLTAQTIQISSSPYVPGASDVALAGVVSSFDNRTGFLTINGLSVYVMNAVGAFDVRIAAGAPVEILGRQAMPMGQLWATEIRVQSGANRAPLISTQAIEGTGISAQSIEGTGISAQAIEGTGIKSTQAIEGTGIKSTQAIEGTGIRSAF